MSTEEKRYISRIVIISPQEQESQDENEQADLTQKEEKNED